MSQLQLKKDVDFATQISKIDVDNEFQKSVKTLTEAEPVLFHY